MIDPDYIEAVDIEELEESAEVIAEIYKTLERIEKDEPKYFDKKTGERKDGEQFRNDEGRLPKKDDPYYYESWTVRTPGTKGRGKKRIVPGKNGELYYTKDHYGQEGEDFKRIKRPKKKDKAGGGKNEYGIDPDGPYGPQPHPCQGRLAC